MTSVGTDSRTTAGGILNGFIRDCFWPIIAPLLATTAIGIALIALIDLDAAKLFCGIASPLAVAASSFYVLHRRSSTRGAV